MWRESCSERRRLEETSSPLIQLSLCQARHFLWYNMSIFQSELKHRPRAAHHFSDDALRNELSQACAQDLVNCLAGRKIHILHNVCAVDERGVYLQVNSRLKLICVANSPIAFARLLVDITRTFFLCFNLSSCVSKAFTTRRASEGSVPAIAPARAAVKDSTSSVWQRST